MKVLIGAILKHSWNFTRNWISEIANILRCSSISTSKLTMMKQLFKICKMRIKFFVIYVTNFWIFYSPKHNAFISFCLKCIISAFSFARYIILPCNLHHDNKNVCNFIITIGIFNNWHCKTIWHVFFDIHSKKMFWIIFTTTNLF